MRLTRQCFQEVRINLYKLLSIILGASIMCTGNGCKKFVQISPPNTQIVTATVFADNNAATAAMTVIYSEMQSESWYMSQNSGLLSDELSSNSTNSLVQPYYLNALTPTTLPSPGPWVHAYNYIYQANAVIEGLRTYGGGGEAFRKQLTGEAEFVRAFWYFYLVNCYGNVPLATTTDYKVNATLSRASKQDVYRQIANDLKDAEDLLDSNYIDASDTTVTAERVRPTRWAAAALLARVYLFTGDYSDAEAQATIVISNHMYGLVRDLNSVFLKNSQEAIWQLGLPTPNVVNTIDANSFILLAAPASGANAIANTVTISPTLLNSFEVNDNRRTNWIDSIATTAPDTTYYFPYKYKNISSSITEYTMMLRLAEQYLIRAEARVQQNKDLDKAVQDLNAIRKRAGLGEYAGLQDRNSLLTAILHERQTELFVEWGHRWFDLIRTGNVNTVMGVETPKKGGRWNPQWALYPIPQSELKVDFNLTQNFGY